MTDIAQQILYALAHQRAGQLAQAEQIYRDILRANPNHAEAMHFLGIVLHQTGRGSEGMARIRKSIELAAGVAQFHTNLCSIFYADGQLQHALAEGQLAVRLDPRSAMAHYNLGTVQRDLGQLDAAAQSLRRTIELSPALAVAHENLGLTLLRSGKFDEAMTSLARAAALAPDDASVMLNLGNAIMKTGDLERAIALFAQAEARDPTMARAGSNRLMALNYQPGISTRELFDEHVAWAQRHTPPIPAGAGPHLAAREVVGRMRVGFVSPDFWHHAVATFLEPLLSALDRDQFEITCYAQVALPDATTARFQALADRWRDVKRQSDAQLAAQIQADQIDVLVDLAGHTSENRLTLFARKPAAVQVSYLGWQNTTGLSAIDYRVTDVHLDPPGASERFHTEVLLRLPETVAVYCPPRADIAVAPLPALANGFVTFGSFAKLEKITAPMLESWTDILQRIPRSRLIMYAPGLHASAARDRLRAVFRRAKIEDDRVELFGNIGFGAYLTSHARVDLLLDTFPFNGHTTTCHGLWMGVPTITLAGDRYASRMGLSVLTNLGLPRFIAQDRDEYANLAVAIASDLPGLSELRGSMRDRLRASPLMQYRRFARNFETALRGIAGQRSTL